MKKGNINTVKYWNERYKVGGSWEQNKGVEQSKYFADLILKELPHEIISTIEGLKTIAHTRCGLGQISLALKDKFQKNEIVGYDISNIAIERCKDLEDDRLKFKVGVLDEKYDVIILTNILGYQEDVLDFIDKTFSKSNNLCIIFNAYKEDKNNLIPEHVTSIDENILLNKFEEDNYTATKIFEKIIDTRDSGLWHGDFVLAVYEIVGLEKDKTQLNQKIEDIKPQKDIAIELTEDKKIIKEVGSKNNKSKSKAKKKK